MPKLVLLFVVAGCGGAVTTPCDDSDPVGVCRKSHGRSYG